MRKIRGKKIKILNNLVGGGSSFFLKIHILVYYQLSDKKLKKKEMWKCAAHCLVEDVYAFYGISD